MIKAIAVTTLGILAIGLSACDGGKQESAPSIRKAEGEILPRSVTDDMLPYDTLRSQPPLAEPEDAELPDKPGNRPDGDERTSTTEPPVQPDGLAQPKPDAE